MNEINVASMQQLNEILQKQLSDSQSDWLNDAIDKIRADNETQDIQLLLSAMASRKLSAETIPELQTWKIDEAARVILLQTYIDSASSSNPQCNHYDTVWQAYRLGDENEKTAYVKGLSVLDSTGELLDMALHTGRTNNINLFSAIALHNTYPARHYDDGAFEQLVLKALFLDLDISRINSLPQRLQPGLSKKCMDLVGERLAAERSPPLSIWLAIDIRHLDKSAQMLYLNFLSDPVKEHRYYSLLSLKQLGIPDQYHEQLEQRRDVEKEPAILELLT